MLEITLSRMLYCLRDTLRDMPSLSERIKEAVAAAEGNGYSVAHIAKACGIKPQSVYQWMDGTTKSLDGANLVELAELSGYEPMWIAKEKGPKFDSRPVRQALKLLRQMTAARQADAVKIIAPLVEPEIDDDTGPVAASASKPRANVSSRRGQQ